MVIEVRINGDVELGGTVITSVLNGKHPLGSPAVAGINQHVRDGKFDFGVTDVTSAQAAGTSTARGKFVIVTIQVSNNGKEPRSFSTQNRKVIDTSGSRYAADTMATISMNQDAIVMDMNPGFNITVKAPFDVPQGTVPDTIELPDSAFSAGTSVKLS